MTMTTSQETMADTARRSQDAFSNALQFWADNLQKFVPTYNARMRSATEVVDTTFDFAEHMLITWRDVTKSMLAISTSAATKVAATTQAEVKDAAAEKS
jgi:TRAP-type mannitol/chloroaromatic compound transport system substrate-binding protein